MATAGKARLIEIYVWNIDTKEVLACIKGFHRRAIRQLRFSPNGIYLLSIGEDDDHSLAIYDWANNKLICTAKVDQGPITTCEFKSDTEFVTCGVKHIKFWTFNGSTVTGSRGLMGNGQFEPQISAAFAFSSKTCVTGSSKGNLIVWSGRNAGKRIPAHKSQVWTLLAKGNSLVSGGQDGVVITWDQNFKQLAQVDLAKITKFDPGIRAMDINSLGVYVFGTKGAEIIKLNKTTPQVVMRGHSAGEVWGLCASPNATKFASCGGDKTVRVWGLDKMTMIIMFNDDGRALDWSSNGNFIAYGTVTGHIYTLNPNGKALQIMKDMQSSFTGPQWLEDIKISPSNQMIAFGAHRGVSKIEVMKVNETTGELSKFCIIDGGLTSALTHLDWDVTSSMLVVNSLAYELKFLSVPSKKAIAATGARDIEWHTWTCVLGFPVQGIFPPFSDGSDVNSACRSNSKRIIATGDDFSKVNLYKYPSVVPQSHAKEYIGHSSHVTKVKFSNDDRFLVSVGGYDKTVIIWSTDFGIEEAPAAEPAAEELAEPEEEVKDPTAEDAYNETDLSEVEAKIQEMAKESEKKKKKEEKVGLFQVEEEKGDNFMASKPWIGALREPTGFIKAPATQSQKPNCQMILEYVHGYRSRDCKNNLSYLKDGNVIYHAAALGIVLDKTDNIQHFFNLHNDDILSIAFHPNGILVATGEIGPKPPIYLWNSSTCTKTAMFKGKLEKGIRSLAFSPSGDYLAAIDMSDTHNIGIFDLHNNVMIASNKTDPALVLQVAFKSENELVTIGVKHYMFWEINNKLLKSRRGIFKDKNNILGCLAIDKDLILTGNVFGEMYQWNANSIASVKKYHTKAIDCISITNEQ